MASMLTLLKLEEQSFLAGAQPGHAQKNCRLRRLTIMHPIVGSGHGEYTSRCQSLRVIIPLIPTYSTVLLLCLRLQ